MVSGGGGADVRRGEEARASPTPNGRWAKAEREHAMKVTRARFRHQVRVGGESLSEVTAEGHAVEMVLAGDCIAIGKLRIPMASVLDYDVGAELSADVSDEASPIGERPRTRPHARDS